MRNRDLQNEKLDRIGRKLLETARVRNEEIERIVAAPQLFDAVKARIKAEQHQKQSKNFSGDWRNMPIWNWQRFSLATATFAIFAFCIGGLIAVSISRQTIEYVAAPEIQSPVAALEIQMLPQFSEDSPEIVKEDSPEIAKTEKTVSKTQTIAKQANFKSGDVKEQKFARKTNSAKSAPDVQNQRGGEFYALDYVGSPNETAEDLRIVRAEISRSELFALGVNLPIENESEKIKTDLLVGADGVARGIRFVE